MYQEIRQQNPDTRKEVFQADDTYYIVVRAIDHEMWNVRFSEIE